MAVNPFLDDSPPLTPLRGVVLFLLMPIVIVRLVLIFNLAVGYIIFLMVRAIDRLASHLGWRVFHVCARAPRARAYASQSALKKVGNPKVHDGGRSHVNQPDARVHAGRGTASPHSPLSRRWMLSQLMQQDVDPSDPLRPKFRNYPLVIRATKAMNATALWLFGFKLDVRGGEHAEAAYRKNICPVVVSNHISFLDIWTAGAVIGPYFPVARGDMKDWPIFGPVIRLWGFAGVESFGSVSADGAAAAPKAPRGEGITSRLITRVQAAKQWGLHPPVLVFPEGTCTSGRAVLRFKTGAFVLGKPVLPLAVRYQSRQCCGWVYSPPVLSGIWRRVPRTLVNLFRVVATFGKRIVVRRRCSCLPHPAGRR